MDLYQTMAKISGSLILARALGNRSRNQAELAAFGFDTFYRAAAASQLEDEAWQLLDRRLPSSMFWFEWDRCRRLRSGVVNTFIDGKLSPLAFGGLTSDDDLFRALVDEAGRSSGGRRYLRRVHRALMEHDPLRFSGRLRFMAQ